jgi:hypothetical protein
MAIRGLPGAPDTTFRTRDRRFLSLDRLVQEICVELGDEGLDVSPYVAKSVIQYCRQCLQTSGPEMEIVALSELISQDLRRLGILLNDIWVRDILVAYGNLVAGLDIAETLDLE